MTFEDIVSSSVEMMLPPSVRHLLTALTLSFLFPTYREFNRKVLSSPSKLVSIKRAFIFTLFPPTKEV